MLNLSHLSGRSGVFTDIFEQIFDVFSLFLRYSVFLSSFNSFRDHLQVKI